MMLALALALAAQDMKLDADPAKAALTCAYVAARSTDEPGKTRMQGAAEVSYFLFMTARYMKTDGPALGRLDAVQGRYEKLPALTDTQVAALLPQCDKRFPMARRDGPVTLPRDPLENAMVCAAALGSMSGAAAQHKESTGDGSEAERYDPPAEIYWKRFNAALPAAGYKDEADFFQRGSDRILKQFDLGNAYVVGRACIAQLKG